MDNLKGKTILIGKEPGAGSRLFVSVNINGRPKTAAINEMGSVPNSVSRCKPNDDVAHCRITIDQKGAMILTNLKEQNVTYVNGVEIISKKVTADSVVELGKDRYRVDMQTILQNVSKLIEKVAPAPVPEFSLRPLKKVWDDYYAKKMAMRQHSRTTMQLRSASPIFTMGSGAITGFVKYMELGNGVLVFTSILTAIGIGIMIYSFMRGASENNIEMEEELTDMLQSKYVCPNPKCGRFLGNQPYKLLRQNTHCPYCKCKFIEK